MEIPKLLFKYKSLDTTLNISRIIEMAMDLKIYFPTCNQLNDPFEGTLGADCVTGWAGKGMADIYCTRYGFENDLRKQYRVLSLSGTCFSPQMWAYYSGVYTGVCFGFYPESTFSDALPVKYQQTRTRYYEGCCDDFIEEVFFKNLLVKNIEWSAENEWRIIKKTDEKYISLKKDEIACMIVGNNTDHQIVRMLSLCLADIPVFRAVPGTRTLAVKLLPYDFESYYDGSPWPFISTTDDLYRELRKKN